jgi:hypothetical protein
MKRISNIYTWQHSRLNSTIHPSMCGIPGCGPSGSFATFFVYGYAKNITKGFPIPKSKIPYPTLTRKEMIRLVCHFESDSTPYACLPDYQPYSSFSNNIKRISQLRILGASPSPHVRVRRSRVYYLTAAIVGINSICERLPLVS